MNSRQKTNLLALADLVENLPPENWDMVEMEPEGWFDNPRKLGSVRAEIKCGTACCVLGWAAIKHSRSWPRRDGELSIHTGSFEEFFGLSHFYTNKVCTINLEWSQKEKAEEIRSRVARVGPSRKRKS